MSDGDALLAAIIANPDDDTPRLVYADWLQENGQGERAEFIRVQCELARISTGYESPLFERHQELVRRECELWSRIPGEQFLSGLLRNACWRHREEPLGTKPGWIVRRGFVDEARLAAAEWIQHADEILAAHPVRKVTLTTMPRLEGDDEGTAIAGDPRGEWMHWADVWKCRRDGDPDPGEPGYALLPALRTRWPGVEFALPAATFTHPQPTMMDAFLGAPFDVTGNAQAANYAAAKASERAFNAMLGRGEEGDGGDDSDVTD